MTVMFTVSFTKQYTFPKVRLHAGVYAFIFCFFYGCLIELLQHIGVYNRYAESADILADLVGCFTGRAAFYMIYMYNAKQ
jgi:VanZ family protein